jgi:hypothetical protein
MGSNFHTPWDTNVLYKPTSMNPALAGLDRGITYLKNVIVHCDGVITYNKTTGVLAWSDILRIHFNRADGQAILNTVAVGNITLADGEFAYVDLSETNNAVLTVAKAAISTGAASNFIAFNRLILGYRNAASDNFFPVYLRRWNLPTIQDTDGDTKAQVEKNPDEDIIRMDVNGVEAFLLDNVGVLTLPKQSRSRAYRTSSNQNIPTGTWTKIELNGESWDNQNEFDPTTNFRYTAKTEGHIQVNGNAMIKLLADTKYLQVALYKNGALISGNMIGSPGCDYLASVCPDDVYLVVNDYVELYVYHNHGDTREILQGSQNTYMSIHKIS